MSTIERLLVNIVSIIFGFPGVLCCFFLGTGNPVTQSNFLEQFCISYTIFVGFYSSILSIILMPFYPSTMIPFFYLNLAIAECTRLDLPMFNDMKCVVTWTSIIPFYVLIPMFPYISIPIFLILLIFLCYNSPQGIFEQMGFATFFV